MPRVGSSKMKMRASPASHLPSTTFCWLPPLSSRTGCVGVALTRSSSTIGAGERGFAPPRQHAERRQPAAVRQRDVARDGQAGDQALALRSSGSRPMPLRNRVGRAAKPDRRGRRRSSRPGVEAVGAGEHARQLAAAGAEQAGDAEHLAGVQREADVATARRARPSARRAAARAPGAGAHLRKVLARRRGWPSAAPARPPSTSRQQPRRRRGGRRAAP